MKGGTGDAYPRRSSLQEGVLLHKGRCRQASLGVCRLSVWGGRSSRAEGRFARPRAHVSALCVLCSPIPCVLWPPAWQGAYLCAPFALLRAAPPIWCVAKGVSLRRPKRTPHLALCGMRTVKGFGGTGELPRCRFASEMVTLVKVTFVVRTSVYLLVRIGRMGVCSCVCYRHGGDLRVCCRSVWSVSCTSRQLSRYITSRTQPDGWCG